jgi:signal peptidase II
VYLAAAIFVYLSDQATKAWAVRRLRFGAVRNLVSGFLSLAYAENSGVAFGQLQDSGSFGRWFFVVLAGLASVAVLHYFFRTPRTDDRLLGACALLLAGITGNLTDRVRLGYVIDFIDVQLGAFHWPTFNVADAAICSGAFLLALEIFFDRKKKPLVADQNSKPTTTT